MLNSNRRLRVNEKRQFTFHGEGGELLWLFIRCMFLTGITLGIYYPWAKARLLKFNYSNTTFGGSAFGFLGTGNEMFIGLLKGIGILILVMIPYLLGLYIGFQALLAGNTAVGIIAMVLGVVAYIALLLVVMPLAINSSLRYRFGRTTWRSIRWAYTGKNKELLPLFIKGFLLTLVTFFIYNSWFTARYMKYIYSKLHFGSIRFRFMGEGMDLFLIGLKGMLLTIITLGIYIFWYMKNMYKWIYENLEVLQGDKVIPLTTTITGGGLFKLTLTNMLLLIFTLGIAAPWVNIRTMKFIMNHIAASEDLDVDAIEQTTVEETSATGEEISDFLDLGDWGIL